MIQINLLPTVKADYVNAQKNKRMVIVISMVVSLVCVAVIVLLSGLVFGSQNLRLSNAQKQIEENTKKIENVKDLDKILTIQSQIASINTLHQAKPVSERIFGYLAFTTPGDIKISNISTSYLDNTVSINAKAPSIESANRYVDTLKFTQYKVNADTDATNAFSNVIMGTPSKSEEGLNFTITYTFDPVIYESSNEVVEFSIPGGKKVTTRSITELPRPQFEVPKEGEQNGAN